MEAPAGVLSAACLDQEPFFVHWGGALCVGCHAAPGGRARGLGTSSPCLATTTFSLISTTSRHPGFIHLLLRLCIRSDLCISAPPCVRQRPPPPTCPCARPGPVCVSCARPPPPSARTKPSHKGPFAAYWHSAPAAHTVTRVNKLSGLFFWGRGPFGQTTWQTLSTNHRPLWHAARVNAIIQRRGEAGIATIPSHCLRFHINRMSHSHEGRSTLHVYTAEGGEGGNGDNLQF